MSARFRVGRGQPSMAGSARRGIIFGLLTLVVALVCGSPAHADVTIVPGVPDREILGIPLPGPGTGPNIFPLPAPAPREPGFTPSPGGLEAEAIPIPAPRGAVDDGPGSGPPSAPPVRIDADTPSGDAAQRGAAGSAEDPEPIGTLTLDPAEIRQSQSSVNDVAEIEASMRADGWVGEPIDVVRMPDGGLTTVDNTRLLAAKRAGIDVRANVRNFEDPIAESRANDLRSRKGVAPTTWGEAVLYRIGKQNFGYRSTYPSGSPITGWNGT